MANEKYVDDRVITSAWELLKLLEDLDVAVVKFIKKDGSVRLMKCTINLDIIPKKNHPKGLLKGERWRPSEMMKRAEVHKQVRVYDLEKDGWRTINFETAEWVKDQQSGKIFRIKKKL